MQIQQISDSQAIFAFIAPHAPQQVAPLLPRDLGTIQLETRHSELSPTEGASAILPSVTTEVIMMDDGVKLVLEQVSKRLDSIDKRFEGIEKRLDSVDDKIGSIKTDIHEIDKRLVVMKYALIMIAILALAAVAKQYAPALVEALLK